MRPAELPREQVGDGRDQALHAYELGEKKWVRRLICRHTQCGDGITRCVLHRVSYYLRVQAQEEDHEEKKDGPEGGTGQPRQSLWICDKRQTRTCTKST